MMKNIFLIALMMISVTVFGQQEEIKAAFTDYKTAMMENNVDVVLEKTSQRSFDYYGMLIDYALNADSAKVAGLSFMDRMNVLGIRIQVPKEDLMKMDGASYVRYGLEQGLTNNTSLSSLDIGEVTMEGDDKALAQMTFMQQTIPAQMAFHLEEDKWKFDATSSLKFSEDMILQQLGGMGMTENEFIMQALSQAAGGSLTNDIWQPLVK
jgi:hypothetical protein